MAARQEQDVTSHSRERVNMTPHGYCYMLRLNIQVISVTTECSCERIRDYAAGQTGTDTGIRRDGGGLLTEVKV